MQLAKPNLAALDDGVSVGHLRLAAPQRLHLRALQDDPRLQLLHPLEFVTGAAVGDDIARGRGAFLLILLAHLGLLIRRTPRTPRRPGRARRDRAARRPPPPG